MSTDAQPAHLHPVPEPDRPSDDPPPEGRRRRTAWTARELMAAHFPEPKWAVPGVISEGVTLLAGPPKVGKSWLSLGLALAVATGTKAFGRIPVQAGPVLYLALEDNGPRLQTRTGKLLQGREAPETLTLETSCPPLPSGGNAYIAAWLEQHPDARMVVIDVFAKVRGPAAPGASAYEADYAAVGWAKRIADHFGIAVVIVHHVRKAGSDDFLTEVSGTNGLAGAADATLVLKRARAQADGVLHITGRDVEETEHALAFDATTGSWQLLDGPASDHTLSSTRAAILRHVRAHPGAKPKEIAAAIPDSDAATIRRACARMAKSGQLLADDSGRYFTTTEAKHETRDTPEVSHLSHRPSTPSELRKEVGHSSAALSHPDPELSHPIVGRLPGRKP